MRRPAARQCRHSIGRGGRRRANSAPCSPATANIPQSRLRIISQVRRHMMHRTCHADSIHATARSHADTEPFPPTSVQTWRALALSQRRGNRLRGQRSLHDLRDAPVDALHLPCHRGVPSSIGSRPLSGLKSRMDLTWRGQLIAPIRSSSGRLRTCRTPSESTSSRRSRNALNTRLTWTGVSPTASAMCCCRSGKG